MRSPQASGVPLWVKPSRLGSSVGISKVASPESELDEAVETARRHDPRVIIESSASGKEVECSVLGNDDPETSVPGEIVAHADWYDYEAKYSEGGMDLVVPARVDTATLDTVRELAARVFTLTGCSGFARCDFFVTEEDEVLVNELNTIPGFTETSVFESCSRRAGSRIPSSATASCGSGSSGTSASASSSSERQASKRISLIWTRKPSSSSAAAGLVIHTR